MRNPLFAILTVSLSLWATISAGMDRVSVRRDGRTTSVVGKVIVESQDGGLLLEDRAGVLWAVQPDEIAERRKDDEPFKRWNATEMTVQLNGELPGFRIHDTAHYLIAYNTSPEYARWCGSLFERLFMAFSNFWKQRGFALDDPPGPLLAIVFDNQRSFAHYAQSELGTATASVAGYYSLRTNRITMYDLTGLESLRKPARISTADHINRLLSLPQAERTVATIIHEATHQLAFNGGLQTRYADIPMWVSEGIAVYFETPDLQTRRGWRSIDNVNRVRLAEFQQYAPRRPSDSLESLLSRDDRIRNTATASPAYSEAWAINYYLLHKRQEDYIRYLKILSAKLPLHYDEPEKRLEEFRAVFGDDLRKFDQEFLRYIASVR